MADIKTKARGTVKALDKARLGTERLKENVISIKDKSENAYKDDSYSGHEYATNKIQNTEKQIAKRGTEEFNRQGIKAVKDTKENFRKTKNQVEAYRTQAKEKAAAKKAKGIIKSKDKDYGTIDSYGISKDNVDVVAFKKGNTVLKEKIDKALEELKEDGTLQKISEKWFGENLIFFEEE